MLLLTCRDHRGFAAVLLSKVVIVFGYMSLNMTIYITLLIIKMEMIKIEPDGYYNDKDPIWSIWTLAGDDIKYTALKMKLDPEKVKKHYNDIAYKFKKLFEYGQLYWTDTLEDAIKEEYPDYEKESKTIENVLKILNGIFRLVFTHKKKS